MNRSSSFQGRMVISLASGRVIGKLRRLVCDLDAGRLGGLLVKPLDRDDPPVALPFEEIESIGEDAIMVRTTTEAIGPQSRARVQEMLERENRVYKTGLYTSRGKKIGYLVEPYFAPEQDMRLVAFELFSDVVFPDRVRGILRHGDHIQVGQDLILVPEDLEPFLLEEEPDLEDTEEVPTWVSSPPAPPSGDKPVVEPGAGRCAAASESLSPVEEPESEEEQPSRAMSQATPPPIRRIGSTPPEGRPDLVRQLADVFPVSEEDIPPPEPGVLPDFGGEAEVPASMDAADPPLPSGAPPAPREDAPVPEEPPSADASFRQDVLGERALGDDIDDSPAPHSPGAPVLEGASEGDARLIRFVLGKVSARDLRSSDGRVIIHRGEVISAETVDLARDNEMLTMLFLAASQTGGRTS